MSIDTDRIAAYLQPLLVDLSALALNGKQLHWHVTGRHFSPVHEQLDAIVDDARAHADVVAERAVALGVAVDGRPDVIASTTAVDLVPEGFLADDKALEAVASALEAVASGARQGLDELGEVDPVTQDLVIEVLRGLEKHLWMVRAQLA